MNETVRKIAKFLVPHSAKKWLLLYYYGRERAKSEGWYKYYAWSWKVPIAGLFQVAKRKKLFEERERRGLGDIPVFLVSFNRVSYLQMAIERFEQMGLKNITIIDNQSTYPPLLEYYKTIPYRVITMDQNYGHRVFWECPELQKYRNDFYILSDPDVIPIEECPNDLIEKLFGILKKYPNVSKVGVSLKLDDLPVDGIGANDAQQLEKQFNEKYIKKENVYVAPVDTTFAIYPPDSIANKKMTFYCGLRTGYPYQARHLPWYKTKGDITEEDRFYSSLNKFGTWDIVKKQND